MSSSALGFVIDDQVVDESVSLPLHTSPFRILSNFAFSNLVKVDESIG